MDSARQWMLRVNEPDFTGWEAFGAWLNADDTHLAAYETALAEDAWVRQLATEMQAAQTAEPIGRQAGAMVERGAGMRRFGRGWQVLTTTAFAASLAVVVLASGILHGPAMTEVGTGPGVHRSITLADNSHIEVNGDSHIVYDPDRPRKVTLARGEALFDVEHDDADPFTVMVGNAELVDVGTIFNVIRDGGKLDVAVAEGVVLYRAGRVEIRLEAGDRLSLDGSSEKLTLTHVKPENVGTWPKGILSYDNASLSEIARDLSRSIGKPVRVSSGSGQLRYTGTLSITGDEASVSHAVSAMLGVTIVRTTDAWEMTPRDDPPR